MNYNAIYYYRPVEQRSAPGWDWQNVKKVRLRTPKHREDALDEALAESFPASDPVAIDIQS